MPPYVVWVPPTPLVVFCKKSVTLGKTGATKFPHMPIVITPEIGIPFPFDTTPEELDSFRERAEALIKTVEVLEEHGLEVQVTDTDRLAAHTMLASGQIAPVKSLLPASIKHLDSILTEYDRELLDVHRRARVYVTNRLIIESTDADARTRLKALELLGKVSGVNLFSERVDVTVTHRSVKDIETEIKKTLEIFDAEYAEVDEDPVPNLSELDLDAELGVTDESSPSA